MRRPPTLRRVRYTVNGRGGFPIDMLRYDSSHPVGPEDQLKIDQSLDFSRRRDFVDINLEMFLVPWEKDHGPCEGRWESFWWKVSKIEPIERVPTASVPDDRLPACYRKENR